MRPGIDVEVIESRHGSWAESYFTTSERGWAEGQESTQAALTAIWAIKEAYLKALGIGARVDFREMNVSCEGETWAVEALGAVKDRLDEVGGLEATIRVDKAPTRVVARVFLRTNGTRSSASESTGSTAARGHRSH